MTIEEEIFNKTKIDLKKLSEYGFKKEKNLYKYSKNIMNDSFIVDINIDNNGIVKGKVYDISFKDEYTNFRIEGCTGSFLKKIRDEFKDVLIDIKNKCFIRESFIFDQSNRITKLIKEEYGDEPEFEWEKYPGYATFKNSKSKKWYAIIMNINSCKLKEQSFKEVEIINVKLEPKKIENLLKQEGFYLAYHMNKKNWISIILDNTISDEDIMKLIKESYSYSTINNKRAN